MAASRIRHGSRRKFTQVDRRVINRPDLSFRAVGVLVWLLDKPDGWTGFSAERMATGNGREGRDAIRSALRELEELGYLRRDRVQTSAGLWVTETWVYEHPGEHDAGPSPETENQASVTQRQGVSPTPGKPTVGFPGAAPPALLERDAAERRTAAAPQRRRRLPPCTMGRPNLEQPDVEQYHFDDDEGASTSVPDHSKTSPRRARTVPLQRGTRRWRPVCLTVTRPRCASNARRVEPDRRSHASRAVNAAPNPTPNA